MWGRGWRVWWMALGAEVMAWWVGCRWCLAAVAVPSSYALPSLHYSPPLTLPLPPPLTPPPPQYSSLLTPIDPRTKPGARRLAELAAGHQRFCSNQLANKKTSRVLEVAFGPELTGQYMSGLMFDFDPADSPPWYDSSIARLYQHFERHPVPWKDGGQLLAIRRELDVQKARVFLDRWGARGVCVCRCRCLCACVVRECVCMCFFTCECVLACALMWMRVISIICSSSIL